VIDGYTIIIDIVRAVGLIHAESELEMGKAGE